MPAINFVPADMGANDVLELPKLMSAPKSVKMKKYTLDHSFEWSYKAWFVKLMPFLNNGKYFINTKFFCLCLHQIAADDVAAFLNKRH